jgi:hypothetical protein
MLYWQMAERRISIWTVAGRITDVAFPAAPERPAPLELYRRGESDLVCRDGMWFLPATCEAPEAPLSTDPHDFLGVDLGIVDIATTGDGEIMAGRGPVQLTSQQAELGDEHRQDHDEGPTEDVFEDLGTVVLRTARADAETGCGGGARGHVLSLT